MSINKLLKMTKEMYDLSKSITANPEKMCEIRGELIRIKNKLEKIQQEVNRGHNQPLNPFNVDR
jgi:hypothetical protein